MNPIPFSRRPLAGRISLLATAAASLMLAPCLTAQTPAPVSKEAAVSAVPVQSAPAKLPRTYNFKFGGGYVSDLKRALRETFPTDNVVVSDSLRRAQLPEFELLNVYVPEIGRTIEFLSEGAIRVEVVENAGAGNIWRIGANRLADGASATKMRPVPAPHLFANEAKLSGVIEAAEKVDVYRLRSAIEAGRETGLTRTQILPLKDQNVLMVMGDETGAAAVEGLIQTAERRLADDAAAKVAAFSDRTETRAFMTPHLFAKRERLNGVMRQIMDMQDQWKELENEVRNLAGPNATAGIWGQAKPGASQQVFLVTGSKEGVAALESFIRAAEQLAAAEDEREAAAATSSAKQGKEELKDAEKDGKTEKSGQ